ncbi:MAG: hypothetical protein ACO1N9_11355 [Flavobacterium sp.]
MQNKKVILGVAAGVAALAVAGLVIAKKRKSKRSYEAQVEDAKATFKRKLDKLHSKAEKHYKSAQGETLDAVNEAKERANQWVNKANA